MDFHGGDRFLSNRLTSVRCWCGILPSCNGVLLTIWWMALIVATLRFFLLREFPT
jgi:hypothetical protein